jgi:hypothetical protein
MGTYEARGTESLGTAVASFLDRLADLPPADWLEIGASASRERGGRAVAGAVLQALALQTPVCRDAWQARDDVTSIAWYRFGESTANAWTVPHRKAVRRAVDAACIAVQAICARTFLADEEFEVLYRPFAGRIPVDELD